MAKSRSHIILLNGTGSSGKTTLSRALRVRLPPEFHFSSSDQLADEGFRPVDPAVRFEYRTMFFEGFHKSIAAFAQVGLDLLVEHIVEEQSWADALQELLSPFDVFWVGVHAPIAEIERRERLRGDRQIGEALYHLKTHSFCKYDVEVDTTQPSAQNIDLIMESWRTHLLKR
jgi:chloramphenicol 3-O phosphotransferase